MWALSGVPQATKVFSSIVVLVSKRLLIMLLAGLSWCFSSVIHDSHFPVADDFSNALQRYKIFLRSASFFSKILRFNTSFSCNFVIIMETRGWEG